LSEPHVPLRTCVGCRRRFAKQQLVRFVVGEGGLVLGSPEGRGAYLCRNASCLDAALRRRDLRGIAKRADCAEALERLRSLVVRSGETRSGRNEDGAACEVNGGSVVG
jgi:predicted RNA-binding protein YlxR (DUF448 family)